MKRNIHINSNIFFKDPYIVRLAHDDDDGMKPFIKLKNRCFKTFINTWGFSSPEYEQSCKEDDILNLNWFITSLRSYWCFKDEQDALQFRLMTDNSAIRVHMWPKNIKFMIYEYVDD